MIRPTSHLVRALFFYERMEDHDFVRSFAAMQTWIFDQVDFPGETFRRYIKDLYQENQLVNDLFVVGGQPVELGNITCPLLNISSKQDETAPFESVIILNEMVGSEDNELLELRGPHVGMVAGRSAPKYFWPKLAAWLEIRSGPLG
jgi:polyhydroxyalkanoate synthase